MLARICSDDLLASTLNRNGLLTGRGNRWTRERVTALRTHHEIPCYDRDRRESEGWMNLTEAAQRLGISARTLRLAVERGEIEAEHPLPDGPWVFHRPVLETEAAAAFVARVRRRTQEVAIPDPHQANPQFFRPFTHIARWGSMKRRCSTSGTRRASVQDQRPFQNSTWSRHSRRIVPIRRSTNGCEQRHVRHGLDFVDLQNPQVRLHRCASNSGS